MKTLRDYTLPKEIAQAVQKVRGSMVQAAEKQPLPARFQVFQHPTDPAVIIEDTETGRQSRVPLYTYRAVRETLTDLFG